MKYAALFRGINVGGKNIVKMNDLKQLFLGFGLNKVQTYIQSGNAVFKTDIDKMSLREMIHAGFSERFGLKSDVMIRTVDEIRFLIEKLPFTTAEIMAAEAAEPHAEHLYVYFLDHPPEQSQIDSVCRDYAGPDKLRAGIQEVYLLCHKSIRESKPAVRIARIFDSATARNWKTVSKLYDILTDI